MAGAPGLSGVSIFTIHYSQFTIFRLGILVQSITHFGVKQIFDIAQPLARLRLSRESRAQSRKGRTKGCPHCRAATCIAAAIAAIVSPAQTQKRSSGNLTSRHL